jgi:hypothetical protein
MSWAIGGAALAPLVAHALQVAAGRLGVKVSQMVLATPSGAIDQVFWEVGGLFYRGSCGTVIRLLVVYAVNNVSPFTTGFRRIVQKSSIEIISEHVFLNWEVALDKIQLLASLYMMRTNASYQQAELLRRNKVVAKMAAADTASPEYGAINLLINTWEAISVLVLNLNEEDKNFVFGTLPALHMFTELNDAIDVIGCKTPAFASNFRLLSKQQLEWLKFKDDHYQTGAKAGMHALFG